MTETVAVRTWGDLLLALQQLTVEQLQQPACIAPPFCYNADVAELQPTVCIGLVKDNLDHTRGVKDNKHHPEQVVLFIDANPYDEDGCYAENLITGEKLYLEGFPKHEQ